MPSQSSSAAPDSTRVTEVGGTRLMGRSAESGFGWFSVRARSGRSVNCGRIISIINNCLAFVIAPVDSVDNRPFCSSAAFGPVDEQWMNHKDPWANRGRTGGRPQVVIRSCTDRVKHSTVHPQVLGGLSTGCPPAFGGPEASDSVTTTGSAAVENAKIVFAEQLPADKRPSSDRRGRPGRSVRVGAGGLDRPAGRRLISGLFSLQDGLPVAFPSSSGCLPAVRSRLEASDPGPGASWIGRRTSWIGPRAVLWTCLGRPDLFGRTSQRGRGTWMVGSRTVGEKRCGQRNVGADSRFVVPETVDRMALETSWVVLGTSSGGLREVLGRARYPSWTGRWGRNLAPAKGLLRVGRCAAPTAVRGRRRVAGSGGCRPLITVRTRFGRVAAVGRRLCRLMSADLG
jgi:hypothetical protein